MWALRMTTKKLNLNTDRFEEASFNESAFALQPFERERC